jgi:predicted metal-dependent hydrolase
VEVPTHNGLPDDELPPQFWQGVKEFQQGEFYACHDTLETLWIEAQEPNKTFFQGILQIAVACYHLGNQNWRGAVILLGEGSRRLMSYQPEHGGIDVEFLVDTSAEFLSYLQRLGPERASEASSLVERSSQLQDTMGLAPAVPQLRRWKY